MNEKRESPRQRRKREAQERERGQKLRGIRLGAPMGEYSTGRKHRLPSLDEQERR